MRPYWGEQIKKSIKLCLRFYVVIYFCPGIIHFLKKGENHLILMCMYVPCLVPGSLKHFLTASGRQIRDT